MRGDQVHRTTEWLRLEGTLEAIWSSPLLMQGHLEQVDQDYVQMSSGYLQERRLHISCVLEVIERRQHRSGYGRTTREQIVCFLNLMGWGCTPLGSSRTASVAMVVLWPAQGNLRAPGRADHRDQLILSSQEDLFFMWSQLVPVSWGEWKCLSSEIIHKVWPNGDHGNPLRFLVEQGVRFPSEALCAS